MKMNFLKTGILALGVLFTGVASAQVNTATKSAVNTVADVKATAAVPVIAEINVNTDAQVKAQAAKVDATTDVKANANVDEKALKTTTSQTKVVVKETKAEVVNTAQDAKQVARPATPAVKAETGTGSNYKAKTGN